MKLYTQINKPKGLPPDSLWLPCLQTETIPHRKAWKQPLLLTHIEPLKHYEHDIVELLSEKVYCIGGRTYDRLKEMGFVNVEMHGMVAEDVKLRSRALTPCTWLHGDKFSRDFNKTEGVTAIQTYKSSLNKSSLDKVLTDAFGSLSEIWVYSKTVLEALEATRKFCSTTIHHTESCSPDPEKWKTLVPFYPGEEFD
ncbi:MAG: hypothetical protein CMA31_03255 [Euryarchaeota archaeon]|nr:hypothetical protein [Euryarchaeota archaeon]|tara:strand:- start:1875 stop:2462 length:588 start_codon:yes stop_codon:yes gene_type:complete